MSYSDEDTVADFDSYNPRPEILAQCMSEDGLDIAALTHPGLIRNNNEDHFVVIRKTRTSTVLASSLEKDQIPDTENRSAWLLAVADGLGGHTSGEIASSTAIRTIVEFSSRLGSWIMRPDDPGTWEDLKQQVERYAEAIQKELNQTATDNPKLLGMATTMTAVYLFSGHALFVNVGDSRSYLVRANKIQQVTSDHTLAQDMQAEGASPTTTGRFRNMVTRTFNTDGKDVEFDVFNFELEPDDRLLLCSDGLTDMVQDKTIVELLLEAPGTKQGCERLAQAAMSNGGRDNVTAILVHVDPNTD